MPSKKRDDLSVSSKSLYGTGVSNPNPKFTRDGPPGTGKSYKLIQAKLQGIAQRGKVKEVE
jgi:hypothetical protein